MVGWMSEYGEQIHFKNHVDARAFCKKVILNIILKIIKFLKFEYGISDENMEICIGGVAELQLDILIY